MNNIHRNAYLFDNYEWLNQKWFILSKDEINDTEKLKESITDAFEIRGEDIEESDVNKIIMCLLEIMQSKPKQEEKIYTDTINILLLGQTGCGKSTFINSFQNYMNHNDLIRLRDASIALFSAFLLTEITANFRS